MTVHLLPEVGHMEGLQYLPPAGVAPLGGRVRLQYTDPKGEWQQVEMGVPDAMYLLNLLEQWSTDEHLDDLRRPPASPR